MNDARADLLVLARLLLAAVLGGALGWERLVAGKWAGVRTFMVVAMAGALFVGVGDLALRNTAVRTSEADPLRLVQAVAIGIGFLGAGIVHLDRGGGVRGLTTAALVWATAAMGVAVGLGRYVLAGGATALLLLLVRAGTWLERRAKRPEPGPDA